MYLLRSTSTKWTSHRQNGHLSQGKISGYGLHKIKVWSRRCWTPGRKLYYRINQAVLCVQSHCYRVFGQ